MGAGVVELISYTYVSSETRMVGITEFILVEGIRAYTSVYSRKKVDVIGTRFTALVANKVD